jgi:glycine/D-amino acid oxidase-like deaminating enzyme
MQFESYWHDTAPAFAGGARGPVEGHYDVAVIGAGFTGLAAARQLAKAGVKVVVLEAERVGWGASGRNGGHLNNGLAHSFLSAKSALGVERAVALYKAFDDSIDTIEGLAFGTSMPTVPLPGIGAIMRIPRAERLRAISSSKERIFVIRTPGARVIS